jgi:hypothetical protein
MLPRPRAIHDADYDLQFLVKRFPAYVFVYVTFQVLFQEVTMSHIVQIRTQVKDELGIRAACTRLQLAEPRRGVFKLFTAEAQGVGVQLPDWVYPVVCDTQTGALQYDNYNGRWGKPEHLDRFLQMYGVEKAKLEARKRGHSVTEQELTSGAIQLTVEVGGGR